MAGQLSFLNVSFLTFQAVVQVILVCLAGFWAARTGLLNKAAQKNVSVLNVDIFTPALVFSKLAPSLSLKKLVEIIIIPIFYAISTGISYIVSHCVSRYLQLDEYESNFVIAMSVFGNSNSLPVSLTVALAYTLPNLEWDDVDGDNPSKIASRGILYLLIFQQIGQVLRWSWGYNTLLKKRNNDQLPLIGPGDIETATAMLNGDVTPKVKFLNLKSDTRLITPSSHASSSLTLNQHDLPGTPLSECSVTDHLLGNSQDEILERTFNEGTSFDGADRDIQENEIPTVPRRFFNFISLMATRLKNAMNPPLYAMVAAVFVASVPPLQRQFYQNNGFVQNTIAEAINQLGSVSIPLILIVLGSNLCPSKETPSPSRNYKKIVIGSLVSRMIIPPLILLPLIALAVKIFPVSILDDPIFLIVAFVLTISPPAIQLSQICQLNELYESEMAGILFWGYVILTLPTTISTVATALTVLEWAR